MGLEAAREAWRDWLKSERRLAGHTLVAFHDWTFLLGPQFCAGVGNGILLGYLMYSSGLVPRRMAWLGLIGGPLLLIGNMGVLFDWWEPTSVAFLVVPEFLWELFLGIYATVWGFRKDAPILSTGTPTGRPRAV